jgi:hypothetical protein
MTDQTNVSKAEAARMQGTLQALADTGSQLMIALAHERGARTAAEAMLAEVRGQLEAARAEIAKLSEAGAPGARTPPPPQPA